MNIHIAAVSAGFGERKLARGFDDRWCSGRGARERGSVVTGEGSSIKLLLIVHLVQELTPSGCSGLLSLNRYPYPIQHMEGVPLPPGIPGLGGSTDPLEAVLGPFPCVRLQNLPYDVTLEDILLLFQGLVVIDVILVGHGEAFVIFANPMDFQMGLQR